MYIIGKVLNYSTDTDKGSQIEITTQHTCLLSDASMDMITGDHVMYVIG